MEQPIKTELVERFEEQLNWYSTAEDRFRHGTYQVSSYHLKKAIEENELDEFTAEIEDRLANLKLCLSIVKVMKESGARMLESQNDFYRAVYRFNEWQEATERFDPETDTVRAVAEEIIKDEAMVIFYAGKKKADRCRWWYRADRLALIREVERADIEALAREYITANPMRYAVSTGNLTYLKRVA
jgi:predicted Zn-dependent peptidase